MACLAPNKLADGTEVACRECKLCQLKAKNDWVGRNIAESKTNKFCYIITATYGRGRVGEVLHERAVILTYSDCQKFIKLLKRHGYDVRLFITGEYGSERARAHWNIILYSNEPLPAFSGWDQYGKWKASAPLTTRFNWVRTDANGKPVYLQNGQPAWWWPHGFVHIDKLNVQNVKYVCKYVLKDFDANGKQGHKGQSKAPPIGAKYFEQLAEKYVEQGLAPQTPEYRFPESRTREGEPVHYWLKGRSLELFLEHYIAEWARRYPNEERKRPKSDLIDLFEEYGRVVNDERKFLVRQAFPRGETKQPWPEKAAWDQARYELALKKVQRGWDELAEVDERWIDGASDGKERQRREEWVNAERRKRAVQFHTAWDRHRYDGAWEFTPKRTGPCDCCASPESADDQLCVGRGPGHAEDAQSGVGRPAKPDYGFGPVGRYNRDYADSGGTGDYAGTGRPRPG